MSVDTRQVESSSSWNPWAWFSSFTQPETDKEEETSSANELQRLRKFEVIDDVQGAFVEKYPLITTIYLVAGVVFGFNLFHGILALAVGKHMWKQGPRHYINQVTTSFRDISSLTKKGEEPDKPAPPKKT